MIPLFDLDWTLLQGGNKAHVDSFAWALRTIYGVDASLNEVDTEGMTDAEILTSILELHGVTTEAVRSRITDAAKTMTEYFLKHEDEGIYTPLPGAMETLIWLQQRHVPTGLLTGNVEGVAWRKCEKAGMKHLLSFGAFGNEAFRRPDLVPIAKHRAMKLGYGASDFIIIGDSPRDIACAKEAGIRSIGVASGTHSIARLQAAGADVAIGTLLDIAQAFSSLGLRGQKSAIDA
jgi:phosphoglycolate phosphatase-like HAD superfamily hydrolase